MLANRKKLILLLVKDIQSKDTIIYTALKLLSHLQFFEEGKIVVPKYGDFICKNAFLGTDNL